MTKQLNQKLQDYLNKNGFNLNFEFINSYENDYFKNTSFTSKYRSWNLLILTGITKSNKSDNNKDYDIDLINKITKLFYESNDEDLINIAWNTFINYCHDDNRYILYAPMRRAYNQYQLNKDNIFNNHTNVLETDRLILRPNNDKDNKMCINTSNPSYISFNIFKKDNNELIGIYTLSYNGLNEDYLDINYYFKDKEYIKESIDLLVAALRNKQVIFYIEKHKDYIFEEYIPNPIYLRIEVPFEDEDKNNITKTLGFELVATKTNDRYSDEDTKLETINTYLLKIRE